jgi:transposase
MMGRREHSQGQFLYAFDLDKVVSADHLVRQIDAVLDLSWVHGELRPYYSHTGRPSIDPVLMIRMLLVGYVFALRSERRLCSEVQVNLAYRWFCKLSVEDKIPDHSVFSRARHERFRESDALRRVFEGVVSAARLERCKRRGAAHRNRAEPETAGQAPRPRTTRSNRLLSVGRAANAKPATL